VSRGRAPRARAHGIAAIAVAVGGLAALRARRVLLLGSMGAKPSDARGLAPGMSLGDGKYVLGDRIGAGGMGAVYRAEQCALARTVAIKLLHDDLARDPRIARRFRAEALAAARLAHPNLVAVLDWGETADGRPFLVMEYVRGRTLSQLLRDHVELPLPVAIELVGQILAALGEAHAAGVVHADVKSDNVLVEESRDGALRVKLVDFGLARLGRRVDDPGDEPDGATDDGRGDDGRDLEPGGDAGTEQLISGTPEYMAPEVIRGDAPTPAADLYAVGVILYEMLTGATPFGGGSAAEILIRHLEAPLTPPSRRCPERAIPPEIERVVQRALARAAADRFPDAAAFAAALAVAGDGLPAVRLMGTPVAASTDVTTLVLPRPRAAVEAAGGRRLARGSGERITGERRLRAAIGAAIMQGVADDVAAGYLDLAEALARRGHPQIAIRELEEGLELLTGGDGLLAGGISDACGRLLLALIPLYEAIGDVASAARAATAVDRHATLTALAPPLDGELG